MGEEVQCMNIACDVMCRYAHARVTDHVCSDYDSGISD